MGLFVNCLVEELKNDYRILLLNIYNNLLILKQLSYISISEVIRLI